MLTNDTSRAPLSFAQQRLWIVEQFLEAVRPYNARRAFCLQGPLDIPALERSLNAIVRRHDVLRTSFPIRDGEPGQAIAPTLQVPVTVVELGGSNRDADLLQCIGAESARPFDLSAGPLVRATVFGLGPLEHVLLLVLHHAVWDGASTPIFNSELGAAYRAYRAGREFTLPPLALQYADFSRAQRDLLEAPDFAPALNYWLDRLAGAPGLIDLPADRERPATMSFRGAVRTRLLPRKLADALRDVTRRARASSFMTLLAAFGALLYRYTGQRELVIGAPFAGRSRRELEELIGFFVNTLPLRMTVAPNTSFAELLEAVRNDTLDAYDRQDVPFERLVAELHPERSLATTPLFNVMFLVQGAGELGADLELEGLTVRPLALQSSATKFDLTFRITERAEGLLCSMQYATDLFDAARIDRMLAHFERLLAGALDDPTARIAALPILDAEDTRRLSAWNDTAVEFEPEWSVYGAVARRAERNPDAVAVEDEHESLTARELIARAKRVASRLRARGIERGDVVGIVADRRVDVVAVLVGILAAGAAVAPFDPRVPSERLGFMLGDADARLVIADRAMAPLVASYAQNVVALADVVGAASEETSFSAVAPSAQDPAYLIYTSGSTGLPKGVVIPHRALGNLLQWAQQRFPLGPDDAVLQSTSYSFDPSLWETFWPLCAGARLVLASNANGREPASLLRTIVRADITVLEVVPTLLRALLAQDGIERCTSLRHVFCGGDVLGADLVTAAASRVPGQLHNLYGPAETAIWVVEWSAPPDWSGAGVPIGRPISNTRTYVLDENVQPVPPGIPGELYIGGAQVGLGYHRRPKLTAERFVPDRFSGQGLLYRTGDRVCFGRNGELTFIGRVDRQFKLRGVRVEPAEVEAALRDLPSVRDAAVLLCRGPVNDVLAAYVVPAGSLPTAPALRASLASRLPEAMIPATFTAVDALPQNTAGKVDYAALPPPTPAAERGPATLQTPNERLVAGVWTELLGCASVDREADFFELGGHSLSGMQVVSRLRRQTGVALGLRQLFETPTVAGLARLLDQGDAAVRAAPNPVPAIRAARRPWEPADDRG